MIHRRFPQMIVLLLLFSLPRECSSFVQLQHKRVQPKWHSIGLQNCDSPSRRGMHVETHLFAKEQSRPGSEDDDEEESISLEDDDWRAFRAMLVKGEAKEKVSKSTGEETTLGQKMQQQAAIGEEFESDLDGIGSLFDDTMSTLNIQQQPSTTSGDILQGMTPLDPSQWAYDSGNIIEQGAVILGGVEQKFGFGLRQQYFHKAAILVLDHDENTFTKGIILNRPTDLYLEDDLNDGVRWQVWFGGDVQGLNSVTPDIVCLHSLKDERASKASIMVMKDIQWTSFDNAKRLVKAGVAEVQDFWVFVGYAGWGPRQLAGELERQSWYMVATDSQTLLKELARLSEGADPRGGGLEMWTLLMNMIGRGETAEEYSGDFDDLMLKEWAFKNLLSAEAGGGAGRQERSPQGLDYPDLVNKLVKKEPAPVRKPASIVEGSVLRASPKDRSPFLLDNQELHKAVVLIVGDDDMFSVGVLLNRPAAKGLEIKVSPKNAGMRTVSVPLRYGGPYAVKGTEQLLWLHCSPRLRKARIGSPIGIHHQEGIWKCKMDDVVSAIGQGIATPEEFIVISGVLVWGKGEESGGNGIEGEIEDGRFEIIPSNLVSTMWSALLKQQEVLTSINLIYNLELANEAWASASATESSSKGEKENGENNRLPIVGIGEEFDEEDDSYVFKSDVKVSKLSDDALRSWMATFLLGYPALGG